MFNMLSDDAFTIIATYCTVPEMFAIFCIDKENSNRYQAVLDRRYKSLNIRRYNLHRYHFAVQTMMEKWRLEKAEKQRRIAIPMYNNRRRLRSEDTPVLMF